MVHSMTAFGRVQLEESGISVIVEIRTLNSRSLDVVVRLPKAYLEFEDALRKQLAQSFRRGRIEMFVQIETTLVAQKVSRLNMDLARLYWDQLQELHRRLPGSGEPKLDSLLQIPFIFESREADMDRDALKEVLTKTTGAGIEQIQKMRRIEGEALQKDCLDRIASLNKDLKTIEDRKELILLEYGNRLRERIQELLGDTRVDENRLLQEVACMAERSDINEEIVRLLSHLNQLQTLLTANASADGRRLDFITQELHREVNTIGSKISDLETNQTVVRMKSEIGKLKEQVQNIE
ncbi:MAG: YicC/YloC family endoribonuclease [Syntrophobacteraceae bacterium]